MRQFEKVQAAAAHIKSVLQQEMEYDMALILGSGLGELANEIEDAVMVPYEEIPHFPRSTVPGHQGRLVFGILEGRPLVAMQGRVHYYEGYAMQDVVFPIRVFQQLGIRTLIVTNAAGGVNESYRPGDLMLIRDQINFTLTNPLIGENENQWGVRFPDTSRLYDEKLRAIARESGDMLKIPLKEGVYFFNTGPAYETPAEVRMARKLGADAVGMSTVPEGIAAAHAGIAVLGISLITNMAAGILPQPLSHTEVVETAERVKPQFTALLRAIIERIG